MITVYCALYPEARELVRVFQLKREGGDGRFQVFSDSGGKLRLVITGVGAIAAAVAVAEMSISCPPGRDDLLVNYGSCAAEEWGIGTVCLCNRLTDVSTGRSYYPDMVWGHPFGEAELVTVAGVIEEGEPMCHGILYDMEAAAIYQAGNYYYGPHQMLFLKVVTDHGVGGKESFQDQMDQAACAVVPFLQQLMQTADGDAVREMALRKTVQEDAVRLGELFHCTVAMQRELEQFLYYYGLVGCDYGSWVQDGLREGRLPAKDKREGKKLFEEFKVQTYLCGN